MNDVTCVGGLIVTIKLAMTEAEHFRLPVESRAVPEASLKRALHIARRHVAQCRTHRWFTMPSRTPIGARPPRAAARRESEHENAGADVTIWLVRERAG